MDNTLRFSNRVENYIKYRPHYPASIIQVLEKKIAFTKNWTVADFGAGTGISSLPFLENGNALIGLEPNTEMRLAAVQQLSKFDKFESIAATAEESQIESESVDLVIAAQAFHWFDPVKTKIEINRILKPQGHVCIMWNRRKAESTFQKGYEELLNSIPAYQNSKHVHFSEEDIAEFLAPSAMEKYILPNEQTFDLVALKGRLQSSSYCPNSGEENKRVMKSITELFEQHQKAGQVTFAYDTCLYIA